MLFFQILHSGCAQETVVLELMKQAAPLIPIQAGRYVVSATRKHSSEVVLAVTTSGISVAAPTFRYILPSWLGWWADNYSKAKSAPPMDSFP